MATMQVEKLQSDFKHVVTDLMFFASYHKTFKMLDTLEHDENELSITGL